ncbi:MAG: sigma-70 family RNA polymerase sigma factor [Planctomycetes bacterium]|nr:sigma-70 family RNA polymerase sigma factor [Planctomycetota bacterium]
MNEQVDDSVKATNPAKWVDRHGDMLYRYALSRLRNAEAAEEVVQETFFAGLKALDQYSGQGTEAAWLLGILKRKIIDYVRQRNRSISGSDPDSSGDVTETLFDKKGNWRADPRIFGNQPEAALERNEFWKILRDCLSTLPVRQADVFTLREIEGLSSKNICAELDVSESNLWVMLYRARMRLSACLKSHWSEVE